MFRFSPFAVRSTFVFAAAVLATASLAAVRGAAATPPPPYGWPELLRDQFHSSVSPDTKLNVKAGPTIGINWMSALRSADLGSPVTAYNAALGKTVAYVGDERGDVIALDEQVGTTLWSTSVGFGDSERATPMIAPDGSVWAATSYDPTVWKLDGTTGKVLCSFKTAIHMDASLVFATPPGGVPTVYGASNDAATISGEEFALRESDCKPIWRFTKWLTHAGAWATPVFGVDAKGNGRVYVGTSDPDSTMYAVDANTGQAIWHFSILNPPPAAFDIGAAATVSPPGNNGFADGVLYFPSKYGIMYALDLTTGKVIWEFNFNKQAHVHDGGRSSAALYKRTLVYGMADGVEAVDAVTGALLWHYIDPARQEVISSPAIAGPVGQEVVVLGDVTGAFRVLRLSDGAQLYSYQTGNYITSSPAIINGHVLIASSDGFLYDFTGAGGNSPASVTKISSPATGSDVANPGGNLTVKGSASGKVPLTELQVSVQMGGPTGPWFDAATGTWVSGAVNNFVSVDNPGQPSSTWSFQFPVPPAGSTYQVTANSVNLLGAVDRVGAQSSFSVMPNPAAPQLTVSTNIVAPTASFTASATGFAANETIDFVLQGAMIATAKAGASGSVSGVKLTVPRKATFGPSALVATGETSHKSTTAPVDVTNTWTQAGYSASRTGYEPNDPVLSLTLQATHDGYLSRAWLFLTGAPVDVPPAIVGGTAYVANDAGTISAVDTASGAPFWTQTISSKAAIHAAPAVADGAVIFGADDQTLYRLASATGNPIGSLKLDGTPTAPAVDSGTIYVATSAGSVYAIDASTGATLWKVAVGAAVHVAVTVDPVTKTVIAGDAAGNATVLTAATGAKVRTLATGSAITAAPVVSGGDLFVASTDGNVRAYDEAAGTPVWTYATKAPVRAVVADGSLVFVGNDEATVACVRQRSGTQVFSDSKFGSAIAGIAHSSGVIAVTTSQGAVHALKDNQGGRIQYTYHTKATIAAPPVIVDGTVYVGAHDTSLYTFTNHGQAPQSARQHLMLLRLRALQAIPSPWSRPKASH